MGLPRMREEQAAELKARDTRLILGTNLPEFCKQECLERTPNCAAGWILEAAREAKRLSEFPERYDAEQIRILKNEKIMLEPQLLEKAEECVEIIESNDEPIIISLSGLDVWVDFVQSSDEI